MNMPNLIYFTADRKLSIQAQKFEGVSIVQAILPVPACRPAAGLARFGRGATACGVSGTERVRDKSAGRGGECAHLVRRAAADGDCGGVRPYREHALSGEI